MISFKRRVVWLGAGLVSLACSSGGGNGVGLVGTWTFTSGSVTPMMCSVLGLSITTSFPLAGQELPIVKGADSSHVEVSAGSCPVTFTVTGTSASAAPGQACNVSFGGISAPVTISSWTLTLTGDTLTSSLSGSAPTGGPSCTLSGAGTLTPSAPDASAGG